MRIVIPKVLAAVDLAGYAGELAGQFLHVWVNPPLEVLRRHDELVKPVAGVGDEERNRALLAWYAVLWSQGPEPTHWTTDELLELERDDPALLSYLIRETWAARGEHVGRKKKS